MKATTSTTGMTFVQAAELLAEHLAHHQLPEPASLVVMTRAQRSEGKAQLRCNTLSTVAAQLLAWADTLSTVTVEAWRTPSGDRVHLSIASTLTGSLRAVELDVYGGADHDPVVFADLAAGEHREVSLRQLRAWATSASDTTEGSALS